MKRWQLQEAKARFSEVVKNAATEGPQEVTVHGKSGAVVLSRADYDELTAPKISFVRFLRSSPLVGSDLDLEREQTDTRDVPL
ncbi:MAG: type II toxin-antitoxin system Phd/YefM family antitoxin [Desulfovibrionales bacterium]